MSTITRERLLKIQQWRETYGPGSNVVLPTEEAEELARISLALLDAEPVAWTDTDELRDVKNGGNGYLFAIGGEVNKFADPRRQVMLYTTPPAPVVPEEMPKGLAGQIISLLAHNIGDKFLAQKIWNACRTAMLQGADGNSPVVPDGWVACSERMPEKNERVLIFINFNCDSVPPSIHDAQFTGSTFRRGGATVNVFPLEDGYGVTHWMPLPTAPQQEETAKPKK